MLYILIQEAIDLNLGHNTGCPEVFWLFPQSLQAFSGEVSQLGHNHILTNSFQFTSLAHPNIQHTMLWGNENIVQQTTKEIENLKLLSYNIVHIKLNNPYYLTHWGLKFI